MKKILGILILGLLWCNVGISRNVHINLPSEYKLEEIGSYSLPGTTNFFYVLIYRNFFFE